MRKGRKRLFLFAIWEKNMRRQKDYKKEYAVKLIEWFRDAPLFVEEAREVYSKKNDRTETVIDRIAAPCPSVVRFADSLKVGIDRIMVWREKEPDFKAAYEQAMHFQEEWLMNAAGLGFYNSSMSIMALKANHGWSDKQDKQQMDEELKQVLVQFVKEKGEKFEKSNGANSGNICSADDAEIPD